MKLGKKIIQHDLKHLLIQRDFLKQQKDTLNALYALIIPVKRQIEGAESVESIFQDNYSDLKVECINREKDNKVIRIDENREDLSS